MRRNAGSTVHVPNNCEDLYASIRQRNLTTTVQSASVATEMAGKHESKWLGVLKILSFAGVVLISCFLVHGLISKGLRMVNSDTFGAWNAAMQGRAGAQIIISGSSRAAYHYDPRTIEQATGLTAFNIGRNGSQTDVQLGVLRAYLEHNQKPEVVVQNLDAFTFVTTREVYDPALYVPYLDDPAIYAMMKQLDPELIRGRYLPLYNYTVEDMNFTWWLGLRSLVGINPRGNVYLGFTPRYQSWTGDFAKFKAANPQGVSFPIEPKGIAALQSLIDLCKAQHIRLILVYSPEFLEMQRMTRDRSEIFAEFQTLAQRNDVPLWDYSGWAYGSDREMFYNSQHLNADGAALFSTQFAHDLASYLRGANLPHAASIESSNRPASAQIPKEHSSDVQ